jgi:L-amino acid N-acyltransferase YncA
MGTSYGIRLATESDLVAINDIYNQYVLHSTCTYQEEPETLDSRRRWFSHHGDKYPVIGRGGRSGTRVGIAFALSSARGLPIHR